MGQKVSPLSSDIDSILADTSRNFIKPTVELILKDGEDLDYTVPVIVESELTQNYNEKISDIYIISVLIPKGDYIHDIFPKREVLECEITKLYQRGYEYTEEFDIMLVDSYKDVDGGTDARQTKDKLNKEGMLTVTLQLVNKRINILRLITVSKSFFNVDLKTLILTRLQKALSSIKVDGKSIERPINMVEPDNTQVYTQILVDTNTRVIDLASILQTGEYGVYNGHLGTYLTKKRVKKEEDYKDEVFKEELFIYPLYKTTEFENTKRRIKLYSAEGVMSDLYENVHLDEGDDLSIIVSDQVTIDRSDFLQAKNESKGYKSFQSSTLLKRNIDISENKISTNKNMQMKDEGTNRKDGLNISTSSSPSDNFYKNRSKLLKNAGTLITVTWNNSVPELLEPNMAVRYYYLDSNREVQTIDGILQNAYTRIDFDKKVQNTVLYIFVSIQE